jgi:hypothetical protein
MGKSIPELHKPGATSPFACDPMEVGDASNGREFRLLS